MTDRRGLRARGMRREPTPAERRPWSLLRDGALDGLKFRRQVPLGAYIADFACLYPRVIVECDGGQHADSAYDAAQDARPWDGDFPFSRKGEKGWERAGQSQ